MDFFKNFLAGAVGKRPELLLYLSDVEAEQLLNTFYISYYGVLNMEYFTKVLYFDTHSHLR